jgi:hypothetical protein
MGLSDDSASWGFHPGGWGRPPVDEWGRPLWGGDLGQASNAAVRSSNSFPLSHIQ